MGDIRKAHLFREELSEQSVEVLVGAALPVTVPWALAGCLWPRVNPAFLGSFTLPLAAFRAVPASQLGVTQIVPESLECRFRKRPQLPVDGGVGQADSLSHLVGAVVLPNERQELCRLCFAQLPVLLVGGCSRHRGLLPRSPDTVTVCRRALTSSKFAVDTAARMKM